MKKYFAIYALCLLPYFLHAQSNDTAQVSDQHHWRIELSLAKDFTNVSFGHTFGYIMKGKRFLFTSNHFDLLVGAAFQNSLIYESENEFTDYVDGYTRDLGFYGLFDVKYYPFKKKKFYLALEHFAGVTNLKSKGDLTIPELDIDESYKHYYTYFNYGMNQSIGLQIKRVNIDAFVWLSLKGFLDEGRYRPADFDSRMFFGINAGYTF